jgi:hypothetical protein
MTTNALSIQLKVGGFRTIKENDGRVLILG